MKHLLLILFSFVLSAINAYCSEIKFIENKGQVHDQDHRPRPDILFSGQAGGMVFHLKNDGLSYQLYKKISHPEKSSTADSFAIHRIDINWINSNPNFTVEYGEIIEGFNNYYLASCPNGVLKVRSYESVTFKNVWNGIDMNWYEKNGALEFDFILAPGADPETIKWKIEGADHLSRYEGNLTMLTELGQITEQKPFAFQGCRTVNVTRTLEGKLAGFHLGEYDRTQPLTIDPIVRIWGTYFGGPYQEFAEGNAISSSNEVYISGQTTSIINIATSGAHRTSSQGQEAFLSKFNKDGLRLWSTYYGGPSSDIGKGCAVDASNNVYLTGYTLSNSAIATPSSYQDTFAGSEDAFLVKFNSSGVRQWATYYGGTSTDNATSIHVSGAAIILTGQTFSTNGIASTGTHQTSLGGSSDAFIAMFNTSGQFQWGSYYGGSGTDLGHSCTIDGAAGIYLSGNTNSTTSIASSGSHQSSAGGSIDAFLVKFNSSGSRLWATYYGGSLTDQGFSCTTDSQNNVYLAGSSSSASGIATSGSHQASLSSGFDGFIARFSATGNRDWGTYYGGLSTDAFNSIQNNGSSLYAVGYTQSTSGIATGNGYQVSPGGNEDAMLVELDTAGIRTFGTYYGGGSDDRGLGFLIDAFGDYYLTGRSESDSGIATSGTHQDSVAGIFDAFIAKLGECAVDSSSLSATVCNSFVSPSGIYTWDSSGVYHDTLVNYRGCDSIIEVTLNVIGPPNPFPWPSQLCDSGIAWMGVFSPNTLVYWYDSLNSTIPFDTGVIAYSPFISSTTTYYVQAADSNCSTPRIPYTVEVHQSDLSTFTLTACNEFTTSDGLFTITESGVYTRNFFNRHQCDSNEVYIATIKKPDVGVTRNGSILQSTATLAQYQWIDCGNNYNAIPGAVGKSFQPAFNGYFAVVVTQDNCTDTSSCYKMDWLGIDRSTVPGFDVYPNPARDQLTVKFGNVVSGNLTLINELGQIVLEKNSNGVSLFTFNLSGLPAGIYLLRFSTGSGSSHAKVVKN